MTPLSDEELNLLEKVVEGDFRPSPTVGAAFRSEKLGADSEELSFRSSGGQVATHVEDFRAYRIR